MHVIEFRGLRNLPYRCEYCGEVFTTKKALEDHLWARHGKKSNNTYSDGFFKYKECGIVCEERFTIDQRITLSDRSFEETFEVFAKLQADVEKSKGLRSENKTQEKCFKDSIKNKNEIKSEGRQNKQNNAVEEMQELAESLQEFFSSIADKNPEIGKSSE
ncbi:uncharacterized protein LOC111622048 [Centruroides sculpturatus]|uniref:uncharacterized protein LOC111622048 n=1 Tax=Centruroides sculpturatus TaxID=218467 RepID=UPI000C6EA445|nr:uncharacterized protein LOC111622048 [Centruroides sculpturatus]